jgi:hypothetical protein
MAKSIEQAEAIQELMNSIQSSYAAIYESSQRVRAAMQGTASAWNDANRSRFEEQINQLTNMIDVQANQLQEMIGPLAALKTRYVEIASQGG